MVKYLVGADPEVFMRNPNTGAFVSAHGRIKGTKEKPFPVDFGAVQVDGTALEFNIDPALNADDFVSNCTTVFDQLKKMVPGYNVVAEPVATFDPEYFEHGIPPNSKALGCDPDFNAWTGEVNAPPNNETTFRTAAGHIHIGWTDGKQIGDEGHFVDCRVVSKQMDYYVGIYSLLWDPDPRRRELYGKAGAFRPKPYGCEYRVPSNVWLQSPMLMRWVYNAVIKGMEALDEGKMMEDSHENLAQEIIDNNAVNWPNKYQFVNGLPMPPKLKKAA